MRLFLRSLFVFLFLASVAYAMSGSRTDFICFGYGDGKNNTQGTKFYAEGQTTNDPAGWCQGYGGCYVNCVDPRNNGIKNATEEVINGTPNIKFKDSDEARNLARFWCPVTSCYEPSSGSQYSKYKDAAIICSACGTRQFVRRPSGGSVEPPKEPEKPADLIVEEINNIFGTGAPANLVYTRTTGSDLKVRIFHKNNAGWLGSGLKSASCTLSGSGRPITASANWNIWGGGTYVFEVKGGLSKAGHYNLKCSGVDKSNKNVVSPNMSFYVAPASYTAGLTITAHNGQSYTIGSQKVASNGAIQKLSLNGNDIVVQKVGNNLDIALSGSANTKNGSVDSGVRTRMQRLSEVTNVIQGLNATSGTRVCQADAPKLPQNFETLIINGNFNGTEKFSFDDVYKGKMTVSYIDQDMKNIIDQERSRGGCSGTGINNGQCPIPPTFEFSFDYLIVPDNFEIKVTTTKSSPIKVLYYGQGNSPANEGLATLKVIPKGSANKSLKNFVNGCAAIDTELELNGADNSIVFIDPTSATTSSTTTLIQEKDFTYQSNQAMANLQRVLSVQNTKNPWNPSMVAEPIRFGNSVQPLVYYAGKKGDNRYPQYTPSFNSLDKTIILRGRVNMIDTDNAGNYSTPTTKVYYEFYCQTCNLNDVASITGAGKYVGSPTSPGWWIDTTFDAVTLKTGNISTTNNLQVSNVSNLANGAQSISYDNTNNGKYEVTINHGSGANDFPTFLLYKPFYNGSGVDGKTSAFVTIYNKINDDKKDFGVDTGAGKNTRSGSRTGGF